MPLPHSGFCIATWLAGIVHDWNCSSLAWSLSCSTISPRNGNDTVPMFETFRPGRTGSR
ncbi:hypothetical protein PR002_g14484 [Phytophthora rubi]|uniref:Uncharacterized protein n=1 Tax=Phytophthora rubi TaxID=129364 RepID=A0A6A3L6D6_9STRA|nr:hypothetical protein PR002_g14484 [Phytophthora rubi]